MNRSSLPRENRLSSHRKLTCALQLAALLVCALVAVGALIAELRELQQLQDVRRLVHLAAEVAILEVQEEYFSPQSMAESVARFGLKNYRVVEFRPFESSELQSMATGVHPAI